MFLFSILVAGSFALGALVANDITPSALTAVRMVLAAALLGVAAAVSAPLSRRSLDAPWRYLVLGGLFALFLVTMFEGLKTAPPVSIVSMFTLTPLIAAGFALVVLRQGTPLRTLVALLIGAAGALWVIFRGDVRALLALNVGRGEAIFFWGVVAYALHAPLVPRLNRGEPPLAFGFGVIAAGAVLLCLWAVPDIAATDWRGLPPRVWLVLVYVAVFATAGSFILLQFASRRLPAAKVMAYTYLTPSWVLVWQAILGNPPPPKLVLVGVALTVLALGLLLKRD